MPQDLLSLVVRDFEALASLLDNAIKSLARDGTASVDFEALQRARDAALRGAEAARSALAER